MFINHIKRTGKKMKIYALREHYKKDNTTEDFIVIRSEDYMVHVQVPTEKIREALKQFETGEEVNRNY